MTKLKTLKDIYVVYSGMHEDVACVRLDELKAEAVKWIKRMSNYEALAWKKFFNITEEDLK